MFKNRVEAGQLLASRLTRYSESKVIVFGVPRGGVVVAFEVAKALRAPLSVVIPRKIGAPMQPELALGAVADDGTLLLDDRLVGELGVRKEYLEREVSSQLEEINRRRQAYRVPSIGSSLEGRVALVVDDGIATGATIRAAVRSLKKWKPASVVVAVPVAPPEAVELLRQEADDVVCIQTPSSFFAVGEFYDEFEQVDDDEVVKILEEAARLHPC